MNVYNLICVGAKQLAHVDYILVLWLDLERWGTNGRSLAIEYSQALISLYAEEIASLPDMRTHINTSWTALGSLP